MQTIVRYSTSSSRSASHCRRPGLGGPVALAIAAVVVLLFLWAMPARAGAIAAGHPGTCESCYAVNKSGTVSFSGSGMQADGSSGKITVSRAPNHSYTVPAWIGR